MKLNKVHTGWAVDSIAKASASFAVLGYGALGSVCEDLHRGVRLLLISNHHGDTIELVEPLNVDSPVSALLEKNGPAPYHVCYSLSKIEWKEYEGKVKAEGFIILH